MICNYNHNTIFHRITRIPIQWFFVAFLCSQIGHSTSCQFDQFFVAFWHSGPHCFDAFFALPREIITIDCCVLLVGTCQPPHLFRILLSCRCPNTPLAICIPCKVCAEVQQFVHLYQGPHASVALRRRLGRAVPSKLIISVGERSERFHRVRALLAVGRVVLSNWASARRVTAAEANAMCYTGVNEESQERVCIGAAAMRWLWCCCRAVTALRERERERRHCWELEEVNT